MTSQNDPRAEQPRHMSVSHYEKDHEANDQGPPRRRSSIVAAEHSPAWTQNDGTLRKMSEAIPNLAELTKDARNAAELERTMSLRTALKLYPKAIAFSLGLSLAVVMEGYDTWLLGSFWGMTAFARKYGEPAGIKDGVQTYQVRAVWQTALGVATPLAQMVGLAINGFASERYGYRFTMIAALVAITCFIFVTFFAVNVKMLLAGYVLCGLPWGVFQTLTVTYAAEVMPVTLRPFLTTYVNLCWVMGQLLASGVLKAFVTDPSQWAYRIPYAIQWIWPLPILIVVLLAPESPWWLVRHGKLTEARQTLLSLTSSKGSDFNVEDTLAMMIHTNELEIQQTSGMSFQDCFKGVDLRRTELTCMTWLIQQTSGSPMIGWGTYFMTLVGLSQSDAYSLGVGQSAMAFVGTVGSWFLMPHFGRRTLYLWGQVAMFIGLIVIGGLGIPALSSSTGWAIGALMLILTFIYDLTVGPVCYSLVAELPSTRLRIKTVVLSRLVYTAAGVVIGALQPRFMNPTAWNWGGKTAFFWAGCNLLGLVWTFFRLPEPKGLTYADLDVLFENKVPARKFRDATIDPFRSDHLVVTSEEPIGTEKGGKVIVDHADAKDWR